MSEESEQTRHDRPRWPRFSLRALLGITALACVLLAPTHTFGTAYVITLCFSLLVLGATCYFHIARGRQAGLITALVCFGIGFFLLLLSIPFFLHVALNAAVCVALLLASRFVYCDARFVVAAYSLALLIPYGFVMASGIDNLKEYDQLRAEYPFDDISDRVDAVRLSRERHKIGPLSQEVMQNLKSQNVIRSRSRRRYLEQLHDDSYRSFVAAQGFGPARMGNGFYPRRYYVEKADYETPLPLGVSNRYAAQPDEVHTGAMGEFLDRDRLGYARTVEKVAGFEGHAFTHLPEWASRGDQSEGWQLKRLQLVSLLRNDEPAVYLTEELPQMEEIAEFPHRPLNDFESKALPKIRTHSDVYVEEGEYVIEMLGAVRADPSCVVCHGGRRGDLLGAFSYELRRGTAAE